MLKAQLLRLREFLSADAMAALDRIEPELRAIRSENEALRVQISELQGQCAALRAELVAHDGKENALAKQMETSLLTIALGARN